MALFCLAFDQHAVQGIVPSKYLLRANSSIIVTHTTNDGSKAQANAYITDNFRETISQYGEPVDLPSPVQNATSPGTGHIGAIERVLYCFGDTSTKVPVILHVNKSKTQVIANKMNPLNLDSCLQIVTADVNGDGSDELIVISRAHDAAAASIVIFEAGIGHSPERTRVRQSFYD